MGSVSGAVGVEFPRAVGITNGGLICPLCLCVRMYLRLCVFSRLQESLEGPDITATAAAAAAAVDDDEEQRVERSCSFSERKVSDNVSACVTETTSSSRQTQWTPERSVLLLLWLLLLFWLLFGESLNRST